MDHLLGKVHDLSLKADAERARIFEHVRQEAIGRHDEPEEKLRDQIRQEINHSHRFDSFADERDNNFVKWHIDGHDYMYALSEMLDSAKESIFILDWWLTPELYLRRPPAHHPEWRLDRVLKRKAEAGVKIYVVVYKEVTQTMSMSSHHTKGALEALHQNIACMRHPDHIGSKDNVEFWSHHEKVVVVDNVRACIGGLDLCFGRWDTHNHPLADVHPTDFARTLFPGQDYNNARVLDFQDVPNYVSNAVSILDTARMPWHDVHMTLQGPVVLDIVQHFTERWNEVKHRKYKDDPRFDWLALPHDIDPPNNPSVARHPLREQWHKMGRQFKDRFSVQDDDGEIDFPQGGPVKNIIAEALVERILRAASAGQKFKVIVVIPEVPGFSGDIKTEGGIKTIMAAQYRTINRGGHSIYEVIRRAGYEPLDFIRFYHLRSYDRINAPYDSLISKMEANSGVKYEQAQVALARQWIGDQADAGGIDAIKEVFFKTSSPTSEGIVETGKATEVKLLRVTLPPSAEEARKTVAQFEAGAQQLRDDDSVSDNVGQHKFEDRTALASEQWLGSEEEEKNAYISELLYIHTKCMIVDDRKVIGDGDSEIALVVEDNDMIPSRMDGADYQASRFAATLRRRLFKEHLGLLRPQNCDSPHEYVTSHMRCAPHPNHDDTDTQEDDWVLDPIADDTLARWNDTARVNREIFTELFRPVPSNLVRSWSAYEYYVPKVKTGHVVPEVPLARVKDRLAHVKGALVECPLDFLIDEKDFIEGFDWSALNPTLPIYL
ncbi:hypothetical protein HWV62_35794 [Athelia sp. TMB]|nr:hypothetical protein HWV62_35794 [Athelia sp. TMB]